RITVLGQINNINQQNFSSEDLSGISSGGGRGGGGRRGGGTSDFQVPQLTGITTTRAAGINYADKWGKKVDVSGSYFFNQTENDASQNLLRQYVQQQQGDSARFYSESQNALTRNNSHRFNGRLEWQIDSSNSLLVIPSLRVQGSDGRSDLLGRSRENNQLLNQTSSDFRSDLSNYSGSTFVMW